MPGDEYVHGYTPREASRLLDQANTLADLLHGDTRYPGGSRVLEAGCGVGSQTAILARHSPEAQITSVDISPASIESARARLERQGATNVSFSVQDLYALRFDDNSFDHVFVCFVLEHLREPAGVLQELKRVLRPGGSITVIEGDHGSFYCHPETPESRRVVQSFVETQARLGGNALIGRALYPLLRGAGFGAVRVSPRIVYVDDSRPELVEGFSKQTFIAMMEGGKERALALELLPEAEWEKGIRDLYRATEADGTFCYTFFKAIAEKVSDRP